MKSNDKEIILVKKLDAFIKKFYLNKIVRGLIISASICIFIFLSIVAFEFFGRFSIETRTVLFFIGLLSILAVSIYLIIIPLLNLFNIGNTLSYKDAGKILGKYFPEIKDKLVNTLELSEILREDNQTKDLIIASINQKTQQIAPIPFLKAVKIKDNVKYLKFLVPIIVVLLAILNFWPYVISEGAERIVNYRTHFEAPPPFEFKILNDSLTARRGSDFTVKVKTKGRYTPGQMSLHYRGNGFFMENKRPGVFTYTLKNINTNIDFYLVALDLNSETYSIDVLPPPNIIDFTVNITPPSYTQIENSTVNNSGDITVPVGSSVKWSFNTGNVDNLTAKFDTLIIQTEKNEQVFSFEKTVMNPGRYKIFTENEHFHEQSGVTYHISVIPDQYPSINVSQVIDSTDINIYYFNGLIDDDYGIRSLTFNYTPGENSDTTKKIDIPFARNMRAQSFYFAFDFSSIDIDGRQVTYYFEVGDNDAVHGSKKSRTPLREYIIPTLRDMEAKSERSMESISEQVQQAKDLSDQIKEDIDRLRQDIFNNQLSEWERNQTLQEIIEKQMQLEKHIENVKEEQKSMSQTQEQYSKDSDLAEKHKQIQELLDSLIDDEMRELMEQLQNLMKEFDMSKFQDIMKDMEHSTSDIEKQMERTLEMLKRLDVENRLNNTVEKLNKLAEEHEKLAEETQKGEMSNEELMKKQDEQEQELENIAEDYEKILEKNQDLKDSYDLDDFSEMFQNIKDGMQDSKQKLENQDNQGASESQMQDSQNMQELSQQMQDMIDSQMQQQRMENMRDLRQIMDNLLTFSFEQEDIMLGMRNLSIRDPRYKDLMVRQRRANDNFNIVRDSLNALASRVPEISSTINREQHEILRNIDVIMDNIADNRGNTVQTAQQLTMTSANNLALMLSEVMQQMQEAASQSGGGDGNCNMGQCGEGGQMGQMRDLMDSFKQQLQDMIDMMQNGEQPGPGQSEELAKMLKQQELMQNLTNEMMRSGEYGPETTKILNEINKMIQENIEHIINRNVNREMVERHEMITSKMLEAENSEREREIDEQRESEEARDYKLSNPDKAFKEKEEELRFNELLQISNIKLNNYYQNRYKEYLKKLSAE